MNLKQNSSVFCRKYSTPVQLSIHGSCVKLSLSNAPVNALSVECLKSLNHALANLPKSANCLILSSSFPKVFSAGLDIHYLLKRPTEDAHHLEIRLKEYMGLFQESVERLLSLKIPTAAVISGACPAGGTVLSLCCDYRVASTDQKFLMGFTEVRMTLELNF